MKKILVLLLVISTLLTSIPLYTLADVWQTDADMGQPMEQSMEQPVKQAQDSVELLDAAALPSAVTLVGTKHLPPIDDQGAVGCCASNAITYTQFTNAVSRYLHSKNPNISWNPSSNNHASIFSPKFTYTITGSGTAWVYDALVDHGAATLNNSSFYKYYGGSRYYNNSGALVKSAVCWDIVNTLGFDSLSYRLTDYEQIWVTGGEYVSSTTPKVNNEINVMFTTSQAGRNLVTKIKDALNRGNAVVTGGYPARWDFSTLTGAGTYGKVGEQVIVSASGTDAGGHQVTIVGYDDNITAKINGVTIKGGFLIANSWGTGWCNNGYAWLMYDAVNTVSEYSSLQGYPSDRTWALDQFCFTYWDEDIEVTRPELMLKVDVSVANREAPYIILTRKDKATGSVAEEIPAVFFYGTNICAHPNYEKFNYTTDSSNYLTFSGTVNGASETATLYLSYAQLISSIPEGKSLNDYVFGAKFGANRKTTVEYSSISLINSKGATVSSYPGGSIFVTSGGVDSLAMGGSVEFSEITRFKVTLPEEEGYFISCKDQEVKYGDSFTFTVNTLAGYTDKNAKVLVNGAEVKMDGGVYTVDKVTDGITIDVNGIEKTDDQKVSIKYYVDGVLYAEQSYSPDATIVLPTQPTKTGYKFKGWKTDIYATVVQGIDQALPEKMPSASIIAFAEFETSKTVVKLTGDRYGTGMENWSDQTQLLFTLSGSNAVSEIWDNRTEYIFELSYKWTENGKVMTRKQQLTPASNYAFAADSHLFRFEICNAIDPFVPVKNKVYYVNLTIIGEKAIYNANGNTSGYVLNLDPIYTDSCKDITPKHYFSNGNDFEYWSENTYMTLGFDGIDDNFYDHSNYIILNITDSLGNTNKYSYTPSSANAFYKFSSEYGLVRFPVLEMGFVPKYGETYSIYFEIYRGKTKAYKGTLDDVKCMLEYPITWVIDGEEYVENAKIGEIPVYSGAATEGISYSFFTWKAIPKHATKPAKYTAVYTKSEFGWKEEDGVTRYLLPSGEYAKGFTVIEDKTYYFLPVDGKLFTGRQISVGGKLYFFDDNHAVLENGVVQVGSNTYYYKDGEYLKGWFTDENGVTYYASLSTSILINYSKTIGGKYYVWNDETGLVLADGFVDDGVGIKCYENGVQVIGWHHADGSGPKVENGISEQYSSNPQELYYFLSTTGYMVTDSTYKLGGYIREFNQDHTVKPLNGLQTNAGELYYYVNGVVQTGWQTIDGVTYYFRASDNVYGRAATKWMYIGNKVYYFYASTSATPYALKDSGAIGGIEYTYSEDGYIVYNGFVNCDYANAANSNTAANIQKMNGTTRYYVGGEMQTGWQQINGNWYYFYAIGSANGSGYMCVESRTIGGVYYEFTADGICLNK